MCVFVNPKFKLIQVGPADILLNVFHFQKVNSAISKGRGLLVGIYKLHYAGIAFTMKMNSGDKI
jgi:hypothetical protein